MDYEAEVKKALRDRTISPVIFNLIVENAPDRIVEVLQDAVMNHDISLPMSPRSRY